MSKDGDTKKLLELLTIIEFRDHHQEFEELEADEQARQLLSKEQAKLEKERDFLLRKAIPTMHDPKSHHNPQNADLWQKATERYHRYIRLPHLVRRFTEERSATRHRNMEAKAPPEADNVTKMSWLDFEADQRLLLEIPRLPSKR